MSELGQYHVNDMAIEHDWSLTRPLIEGTFGRHLDTRGKISAEDQVPVFISEEQMPSGLRILGAESGPFLTGSVENSTERTWRNGKSLTSDWGKGAENLVLNVHMF